jgi:hypothetical protein
MNSKNCGFLMYTCDMKVYLGKQHNNAKDAEHYTVMRLVRRVDNKGHQLLYK